VSCLLRYAAIFNELNRLAQLVYDCLGASIAPQRSNSDYHATFGNHAWKMWLDAGVLPMQVLGHRCTFFHSPVTAVVQVMSAMVSVIAGSERYTGDANALYTSLLTSFQLMVVSKPPALDTHASDRCDRQHCRLQQSAQFHRASRHLHPNRCIISSESSILNIVLHHSCAVATLRPAPSHISTL
jgi:hypothetical protein